MMKKIFAFLMFPIVICSCGSMSEISQIGKDTYMVASSSAAMGEGGGNLKAKLVREGTNHCSKQSKQFLLVGFSSVDMAFGRPASAEITFRCLFDNDTEYTRPNIPYEISPGGNSTPTGILLNVK